MNCLIHYLGYRLKFRGARCAFSRLQEKSSVPPSEKGRSSLQARGSSKAAEWKGIHGERATHMAKTHMGPSWPFQIAEFQQFYLCVQIHTKRRDLFFFLKKKSLA